jgi:hypothetical protein
MTTPKHHFKGLVVAVMIIAALSVSGQAMVIAQEHGTYGVMYFVEYGLPEGTEWTVTCGGITKSATTMAIEFGFDAGTYPYTIHEVSGYTIQTPATSGTITIVGNSGLETYVYFNGFPSPVPETNFGSFLFLIVGLIGCLVGIMIVKKKK